MLRFCGVAFCRGYAPHGVVSPLRRPYSSASTPGSSQEDLAKAPLHAKIRASPYVTGKAENIVISSDDQRKQTANTESCFKKLADLIIDAGAKSIPGETSDETRERVTLL
ncbi:hypothetical protein FH972_026198 [Carpinus fangiana]|uniref:Uncharacterized protein n=1 Tax=Carpinus fangiana TaxID=176857 RepID=A0A5N6L3M8_9ROSI|nr:hypothetical protein FH972_026198 [Carpinus fangiana]